MNAQIPVHVALAEPDIESTVLGSLIAYPDAMAACADEINPEWFTDGGSNASRLLTNVNVVAPCRRNCRPTATGGAAFAVESEESILQRVSELQPWWWSAAMTGKDGLRRLGLFPLDDLARTIASAAPKR